MFNLTLARILVHQQYTLVEKTPQWRGIRSKMSKMSKVFTQTRVTFLKHIPSQTDGLIMVTSPYSSLNVFWCVLLSCYVHCLNRSNPNWLKSNSICSDLEPAQIFFKYVEIVKIQTLSINIHINRSLCINGSIHDPCGSLWGFINIPSDPMITNKGCFSDSTIQNFHGDFHDQFQNKSMEWDQTYIYGFCWIRKKWISHDIVHDITYYSLDSDLHVH